MAGSPAQQKYGIAASLRASDVVIVSKFQIARSRIDIANLLEVPDRFLRAVLYGMKERANYVSFEIPRKSGIPRIINRPPKNIHLLQSKLAYCLSLLYQPKICVHGFVAGKGVLTNAKPHIRKRFVLNIDLENFFDFITLERIIGVLQQEPFRLNKSAAAVCAQIATMPDRRAAQGSPCSPILSNILTHALDVAMIKLAKNFHCTYSRYADDLTISTTRSRFPEQLAIKQDTKTTVGSALRLAIDNAGFKLNENKVRLQDWRHRQRVTGITVNEFPNVTRDYIRDIRSALNAWHRHGLESVAKDFAAKHGDISPSHSSSQTWFVRHIKGCIDYIAMIRGQDDFIVRKFRKRLDDLLPDCNHTRPLAGSSPCILRGLLAGATRWEEVFRLAAECVFFVSVKNLSGDENAATAFRLGGQLLTAGHVFNSQTYSIVLDDESKVDISPIRWINDPHGLDIGLFSTATAIGGSSLTTQCRLPEVGESVAAIGYPSQPNRLPALSLCPGTVESLPTNQPGTVRFIQVSFQSGGGLSGSPLIDSRGFVVGLIAENVFEQTLEKVPARSFGQAVPIEYAIDLLRRPGSLPAICINGG